MSEALAKVIPYALDKMECAGREAAQLIWNDESGTAVHTDDPRHLIFARAVVEEFAEALSRTPPVLRKVMNRASSAAEDLNVEPFQGLTEVIQNADDLGATEVRFAHRNSNGKQQLLIVHDGLPVTCGHVLAMTLPFLTTKEENAEQKGRFGIGLKTLTRISSGLSVHSAPYHFTAKRLSLSNIATEPALEGFYDPRKDTLLVLDLNSGFNRDELSQWFAQWSENGLIFLGTVHRFRWCSIQGETLIEKSVTASAWRRAGFVCDPPEGIEEIRRRDMTGASASWAIFSADACVPENLARAHKATGKLTPISVAICTNDEPGALYIAFKTRIPSSLSISLDAQFDPSTAREDLIDNAWNRWLVERCGDVLANVAAGLLTQEPPKAWKAIPLSSETLGSIPGRWPRAQFGQAFERLRGRVGSEGLISMGGQEIMLSKTAYEDAKVGSLLTTEDIERLAPGRKAILPDVRDEADRWRDVLSELGISEEIGTSHLLEGFSEALFDAKHWTWWIQAGHLITLHHPVAGIFGVPFLRSLDGRAVACQQATMTKRPLVFGDRVSAFCTHWTLLDRLHDGYGRPGAGESVRNWLVRHAAYTTEPSAETDLEAFTEKFADNPVELYEADLRELRDRFARVPERTAARLGPRVGSAIRLNGWFYQRGDRRKPCKVSPGGAYLPKTLDPEHPDWPTAAGNLSGIVWLSANYEEQLKLPSSRSQRRRDDGYVYRGPRRFLMLLGAESAPRLVLTDRKYGGRPTRIQQLKKSGAESVEYDYASPDLERLLAALPHVGKRERKLRSAALMRVLSRHWDRSYRSKRSVPAQHETPKLYFTKDNVAADWLCLLRDTPWVAVANADLRLPGASVIRNPQTETLYEAAAFVAGVEDVNLSSEFISALGLISDVRASDLVAKLEAIRAGEKKEETSAVLQIYRTLSKLCPKADFSFADIGDMTHHEFLRRFSDGAGLVCLRPGKWKCPGDLFSGRDVFRKPELFVPSAPVYADLWQALKIRPPQLKDCTAVCRQLAQAPYSTTLDAVLMDLYRYMDNLLDNTERVRNRLATLPLACGGQWVTQRPVYLVEDRELRGQLARALPGVDFWSPPCEVRELQHLADALGIQTAVPSLRLVADREEAQDEGENCKDRFQAAVEHLSAGLARNEPEIREKLRITWDELRDLPLFVYSAPFAVEATCTLLSPKPINITMRALLMQEPLALHVWIEGLQLRDSGGRAIASLFPPDVHRRIEAEWVASWSESKEQSVEVMRLAADDERRERILAAAQEFADQIDSSGTGKIDVSEPASRTSTTKPRRLKPFQGGVSGTTVRAGPRPDPATTTHTIPLVRTAPAPSTWYSGSVLPAALVEYSNADLEQRGWEILVNALNAHDGPQLQDFRKRRGVGADGAIDWKKFVELKASGRSIPNSVEMTNGEYERAKERGEDYILALVYGLEEGYRTEARLIFDPARNLTLKPLNGVRLIGLSEATSIVLEFRDGAEVARPNQNRGTLASF